MNVNFFSHTGKMAIGSRLRMLTEMITEDAGKIYDLYGIELKPKWFPVFFVLSNEEVKTITAIAKEIGHSHPSVSTIIREMSKAGLVDEKKDSEDGRRNLVGLSEQGKTVAFKIVEQYEDVNSAIEKISIQARHDLWGAIGEWEYLLTERSLLDRVRDERKERESKQVEIVQYSPNYLDAFRSLNEEWIKTYFEIEEADRLALDNPENYILQKGGHIFVALYNKAPVGVCALLKMNQGDYDFELAKMAVSPHAQGKNIGYLLGCAALSKAKELGASSVYLESNTILKPAINLYRKLGFKKIAGHATPYKRCNIQMELRFK